MPEYMCRVITHIHSDASNALASPNYERITRLSRDILGPALDRVHWCECMTHARTLVEILDGRQTRRRIDLLFVTDHKSLRQHRIAGDLVAAAVARPRLGIGAEMVTFVPARSGDWIAAPEVLLYGPAEPQVTCGGSYHGLSQRNLDDLFDVCTPPGAPGPELTRVARFCLDRQFAYAASHPLDGHRLPLADLLRVLRMFPFIETVNGGFSTESARLLTRLVETENRRVRGQGAGRPVLAADGRLPLFHIRQVLGGSDAHLRDFDRVVTLFAAARPDPTAGDFIAAMLAATEDPAGTDGRFAVEGDGIGLAALAREVTAVVFRNIANNRHAIRGVLPAARLLLTAVAQLWRADRASRRRQRELARHLTGCG